MSAAERSALIVETAARGLGNSVDRAMDQALDKALTITEHALRIKGYSGVHITDYDTLEMSTVRLFCRCRGTVLRHKWLWIEQTFTIGTCIGIALLTDRMGWNSNIDGAKSNLNQFVDKISTLAAFLLSFYTSLAITRWWRLRTEGIGAMWSACSQLCLYLTTIVEADQEILSAIRRYSRASLVIIFMRRRYGATWSQHLGELVASDLLTQEEEDKLKAWNNNLAESIWTWHAHIVTRLYKQKKIQTVNEYVFVMERVNMGRAGAALIGAQMGTPVPMVYVHVIGLLVKINNVIMALAYGYLMGIEWATIDTWYLAVTVGKVIFIPFLYNAILLINADLADPFDGDVNDFPLQKYEQGMESDGKSYIQAGEHLPGWMEKLKRA